MASVASLEPASLGAALAAVVVAALLTAWTMRQRRGVMAVPAAAVPAAAAAAARKASGPRKVLLLGVSQAGKTSLLLDAALGAAPATATTQHVNVAHVAARDAMPALELVDVPGHARLRAEAWPHLANADAIVFCVDATTASRGAHETGAAAQAAGRPSLLDSVEYVTI